MLILQARVAVWKMVVLVADPNNDILFFNAGKFLPAFFFAFKINTTAN